MQKRQQGKDMKQTNRRTGRRFLKHSRRGATLLLAGTLAASVNAANAGKEEQQKKNEAMKQITPKLLKKVYQFLEGQRDEAVT